MKRIIIIEIIIIVIAFFVSCSNHGAINGYNEEISTQSLLNEMIDRDEMSRFPNPEYIQSQISSYDRKSVAKGSPGWFANNDGSGYIKKDTISGRVEKVLFNENGPGAITRIWMTTNDKRGMLRIYFDGNSKPDIVIPGYDMRRFPAAVPDALSLKHTHYEEKEDGVGGNTFFLPIPYSKSCKITLEEPDENFRPRYYQINFRTYPKDVKVRTFSLHEYETLKNLADSVGRLLENPPEITGDKISAKATILPGDSLTLDLPKGKYEVSELALSIISDSSSRESIRIRAKFDNQTTIDVPFVHLCGSGIGLPKVEGWWTSCDGAGTTKLRFPMPYRRDGEVCILNESSNPVTASADATINDYKWDSSSLYFHISYHYELGIKEDTGRDTEDNLIEWPYMRINGKGKLAGDLLSLYNHTPAWYGEGDEKIYIDGEAFPSHFGTGTEDYFNCSWAPVVPFNTPWGGAPRADDPTSHGYNAFFRTRILDAIPFKSSLDFDFEMISWVKGESDYYATSFWYGDKGAFANNK